MAEPRVTVIIPNWNGRRHLPECLATLAAQSYRDFGVVLVDNASGDDGVEWVEAHHPEVRVLRRAVNGGFARAVNDGIRASAGEYVALLNNDTAVHPRWLDALVGALDAHPDYDLAASLMLLYDQPDRVNAAGDTFQLARLAGRNRGFGAPARRYRRPRRVLGACAGAALYRRRLFGEVGLFDEDFFLMSEDTDFNIRCLLAGKKCLYVPGALVRHKYRASIETAPAWPAMRLAVRNEAMVVAKDFPAELLPLAGCLWGWRLFRQTVPLRPSRWHLVPGLARRFGPRLEAEAEGLRRGWVKRADVSRTRVIGWAEAIRWLARGVGDV